VAGESRSARPRCPLDMDGRPTRVGLPSSRGVPMRELLTGLDEADAGSLVLVSERLPVAVLAI